MGVLACDRSGCDNIMCDYFSSEFQAYLCCECMEDLQKYLDEGNTDIPAFIHTGKVRYSNPFKLDAYEIFKHRREL